MTAENEKKRRTRRTQLAIERDVLKAVEELIEEAGFRNVTLTGVAERAQIEPAVFYRRYANLEELFDRYTQKYDYWLANLAEQMPKNLNEEETLNWVMQQLIQALWNNKGMQQLLIWELSEDNHITRRTARLREMINESLIQLLEYKFRDSGLDINVIAATIISGVYYLILHRKRSSFCHVDFNTRQGKERLKNGIQQLTSLLFDYTNQQSQNQKIAERLRQAGVSEDIISSCVPRSND
jgi:AcrR family transcriptional regulator